MIETLDRVELNRIVKKVIGCAYAVGKVLKYGYLEKVYENAMTYEIGQAGLKVQQQKSIQVKYKGVVVGEYTPDLLVENSVLVELKTTKAIDDAHIAQCLNYLTAMDLRICLLINFSQSRVEFKRLVYRF